MGLSKKELTDLTLSDGGAFGCYDLKAAYAFCENIAKNHYENFPVGSLLVPGKLRKHFFSVYAFARMADDIADEISDEFRSEKMDALDRLLLLLEKNEFFLHDISARKNPVLMALFNTMNEKNIPGKPFRRLITAFKMDTDFRQADDFAGLEYYCSYSANPVGELVLRIFDVCNEKTLPYSDKICTGLQLVNFWQDFSRDLPAGRCYIPGDLLEHHGIEFSELLNSDLFSNTKLNKLESLLHELYTRTEKYFNDGSAILAQIPYLRLRAELAVTIEGGLKVLEKTKKLGIEIFNRRPALKKSDLLFILLSSLFRHRVFIR